MRDTKIYSAVKTLVYAGLLLASMGPQIMSFFSPKHAPLFAMGNVTSVLSDFPPNISMGYVCEDCVAPSVHGANIIEKLDGGLFSTWFGGSREGGRDVVLWGADYSPVTQQWSLPHSIVGPAEIKAALGRYIKTVGNSVLVRGEQSELSLYFVSVSVGGWAGSSLNVMTSHDDAKTWDTPRRLVTSPFFNVSTLNKSAAVHMNDGSIFLPVYHEFFGKFAELLRLDNQGRVLDKVRITHGRHSIQPLLLPLDPEQALALMRDTESNANAGSNPGRVLLSRSTDAGSHWLADERTQLPNPDAAVAGLRRPDGSLILVFNDTESGRHSLALAVSRDQGKRWQTVKHFENNRDAGNEYSYPYLIRGINGTMHLVYTWNRKRIRHVIFNDHWVDGDTK